MGERNGPDSGETTLAAATAAIIAARWQQTSMATGGMGGGSHGTNGYAAANGHASTGVSGGSSDWTLPPLPDAPPPPPFAPVSPAGAFPAPPATPVSPAGAFTTPPIPPVSQLRPPEPAASVFFSAAQIDPVPEVFDPRSRGDAGPSAPDPGEPVDRRTQVPPGFERRTFSPVPEAPTSSSPTSGGGWDLTNAQDRPIGAEPPPSALLGVVPPPAWSEPSAAPSLAPPEPPPWIDTGWSGFGDLGSRRSERSGDLGSRRSERSGDLGSRRSERSGDLGSRTPSYGGEPERTEVLVGSGVAAALTPGGGVPLPRRVPQAPDVDFPLFASDPAEPVPDPATEHLELNRIADYLRDEADDAGPTERPDGVDLESVLAAVRQVPEVRDAQLRWNAQAGHTLRIEFVDGVDESEITRSVVRLLRSRLGLAAEPSVEEPTVDTPYRGRVSVGTPRVAGRVAPPAAGGRPLPRPSGVDAPRLAVENVTVTRLGAEATVAVRLRGPRGTTVGEGHGPGVDAYLSRLAATAAAHAVDQALAPGRGKVFVEHVSVVPFGVVEVAVVVLLLSYDGGTEQVAGSAIVGDDPHQAVVRAILAALNRRLEALL